MVDGWETQDRDKVSGVIPHQNDVVSMLSMSKRCRLVHLVCQFNRQFVGFEANSKALWSNYSNQIGIGIGRQSDQLNPIFKTLFRRVNESS